MKKFDLTHFESLEDSGEILKGGFSVAYTGGVSVLSDEINNCHGGNCASGCGSSGGGKTNSGTVCGNTIPVIII